MRRFSSIGSPFLNAIRKADYLSSLMASPRSLTHQETACLNVVCPRGLAEAMKQPCGFLAMAFGFSSPATSGDLIVLTTFLTWDGSRLSTLATEFSRFSVFRLSLLVAACPEVVRLPVDQTTGEILKHGARLFRVSTLPVTIGQAPMPKRVRLSAGSRVGVSLA